MFNVYKTDYGVFSVIIDDALYNFLKTNSGKEYLISTPDSVYTGENSFPVNLIPALMPISLTVLNNGADIDPPLLSSMRKVFKGIYLNRRTSIISSHDYYIDETHIVNIKERHSVTTNDDLDEHLILNNSKLYAEYYGWVTGSGRYDDKYTFGRFNFAVFNSKKTDAYYCNVYCNGLKGYNTILYIGHYDGNDLNFVIRYFDGAKIDYTYIPDPYEGAGTTGAGGGNGTHGGGNTIFGGASDSVDIPPLPTASASDAGFITLFNPSLTQLNNLANYMWSDLFSIDTFKKIFADPMDCILGLSIVPVKPASAGTSIVKIGNISTDVSMNKTSSQYVAVDCGTIDVKEYWGAYLDYAPYTQCEIYLPYVGTKQISVDDVMNKAVNVVYHVDILSGACNAYVKCGDSVLYTFVGQCSSSIPISGNDWTNVLNGAISVAGKIGLAMATGGATALMSGIGAASSIISSSKPTVERSGAMSSTGGLLGIQKPYLILTRPKQALPENQNKYTGYPSFITMKLADCSGYTEIDSIHLENMSCTDEEAQEIENLLKSGVIF